MVTACIEYIFLSVTRMYGVCGKYTICLNHAHLMEFCAEGNVHVVIHSVKVRNKL